MTDLSPAAQVVMNAFTRGNPCLAEDLVYRSTAAAALRAVVDQAIPPGMADRIVDVAEVQDAILAIANELENIHD